MTRCPRKMQNDLLPRLRLIKTPNGERAKRDEGSTCHICGNTALRDNYMLTSDNPARGISRTALGLFAATVLFGGTATEASAHRYHHYHHHFHRHYHHHASN